jgi:hypothetical protein
MKSAVSAPSASVESQRRLEGDTPGPLALALLEQVAEDGHKGRRERGVGDERPDRVRHEERDLEAFTEPWTPK